MHKITKDIKRFAVAGVIAGATTAVIAATALLGNAAPGRIGPAEAGPSANSTTAPERQVGTTTATAEFTPAGPGASCSVPRALVSRNDIDLTRVNQGVVKINDAMFYFTRDGWVGRTDNHPPTSQMFHTSAWVTALLKNNPGKAVDLLLEQYRARLDTGVSTAKIRVSHGWSESQVTKRMWTVLCVLKATRDERLLPVLERLANANMDQERYYGPPLRHAHNHGVFANEVLYAAGTYLGNDRWRTVAKDRLLDMLPDFFERCGMAYEQSSTYHALNVRLWERQLRNFDNIDPDSELRAPRAALAALARPDGQVEPIGDGEWGKWDLEKLIDVGATPGGNKWCAETGWSANHLNIGSDDISHVVLRFGPSKALHGDDDATSVTWWTGSRSGDGVAVLSERGMYSKHQNARYDFVNSDAAHSVLSRVGAPFTGDAAGRRLKNPKMATAQVKVAPDSGAYTRTLSYSATAPVLAVSDRVTGSTKGRGFTQYWQLAPKWVPSQKHTAVTKDGRTLDVLCFVNGKRQPVKLDRVESFPEGGKAERAYTATCSAPAAENARFDTVLLVDADRLKIRAKGSVSDIRVTSDLGSYRTTKSGKWRNLGN